MHIGVLTDLDYTASGKTASFLSIPWSIDRSPYYQIKIPVIRIRNGEGPRVLLMAGNHGDEYEGTFALSRLARTLRADQIRGELTILPFTNGPAVFGGKRRSPEDNGNLNREFPGNANGLPTQRLAHYIENILYPMHDVLFDMHAGGTSMAHLPTGLMERHGVPNKERFNQTVDLVRALGMPHAFITQHSEDAPTAPAGASRQGIIGLSGEFGGGGTVTPYTLNLCYSAVDNLLMKLGTIPEPVLTKQPHFAETRFFDLTSHKQGCFVTKPGWYEPNHMPGDWVEEGACAGYVHDYYDISAEPVPVCFGATGIILSQRLHSQVLSGDCLVQVGIPDDSPYI